MKTVDIVLNIPKHEEALSGNSTNTETSVSDTFDHVDNIAIYFYSFLMQLVVLACNSSRSSSPRELARHFSRVQQVFYSSGYKRDLKASMEVREWLLSNQMLATSTQFVL